jgi:hypothetical protein
MTTDIARARRARQRGARRGRFAAWVEAISFDFAVDSPPGALGWLVGAAMLLTPPILFVIADRIADRMSGRWVSAARIVCGGMLTVAASFGAEAIALRIGFGGFVARCAFWALPAAILIDAAWKSSRQQPDADPSDPGDDPGDGEQWPDCAA